MSAQPPLELILARNLLSSLSIAGWLVGSRGQLLFYNEAAGATLGRSFEESTGMSPAEWTSAFGPLDEHGEPIPYEQLLATQALQDKRPHHGEYTVKTSGGELRRLQASAIPIGDDASSGAIVLFWPADDEGSAATTRASERVNGGQR
jgi:PAS domain-containing protein